VLVGLNKNFRSNLCESEMCEISLSHEKAQRNFSFSPTDLFKLEQELLRIKNEFSNSEKEFLWNFLKIITVTLQQLKFT
jgi:hypothetical protein